MTLFTRKLEPSAYTKRQFVKAQQLPVLDGSLSLCDYLRQMGERRAFIVAEILDEQDWVPFEHHYASTGRAPYSPRSMMGILLYGIMKGHSSLRALERLARLDLGCIWVSHGITPDHASLGRFIYQHQTVLTGIFFKALTLSVLRRSQSGISCLAGDGTVIEAACSHYHLLTQEAISREKSALTAAPSTVQTEKRIKQLEQGTEVLRRRQEKREKKGKDGSQLRINPTEPDAVVQKLKRGKGFSTAYKPSVLVNTGRIIVAQTVDPSSEIQVMADLLAQNFNLLGYHPDKLLLDAGYFHDAVIAETQKYQIRLFCSENSNRQSPRKIYPKSLFIYDAEQESYLCPAHHQLSLKSTVAASEKTRGYRVYGSVNCAPCRQKNQCTRAKGGRKIKRYPEDEKRDELRLHMATPESKQILSQRKSIVEPVFSALRGIQGLERFRRKGLSAVKLEFTLHAMAYNLSRAVALILWGIFSRLFGQITDTKKGNMGST
ncbi:transposase [Xenorhabdus bovienii]|uniref:transposase n=1 Tax=Xenorhabdus bovienii TaxID=40576 RepID=UPI0023B20B26|nr:transposase [Xenorhabdus bovienii]MDE9488225.1 transposase [Xenorhabdus bovienii]